jgi:branched-chain amino acid transport system permease protein
MVSAGLTLIFGMMGVLNFAHAWFYMLGAYVGYTFTSRLGFWWGLLAAPIVTGFCGILVERYMLRRVHNYGHAHELLLTFGLAFIIEEVIKLFYGDFPVNYQMPAYMKFAAFTLFEANYPFYRLFMGSAALAMFAMLYATTARIGIIVRAPPTGRPRSGAGAQSTGYLGVRGAPRSRARRCYRRCLFPTGPRWRSISGTLSSWWSSSAASAPQGALVASLMIGLPFALPPASAGRSPICWASLASAPGHARQAGYYAAVGNDRGEHAVPAHGAGATDPGPPA